MGNQINSLINALNNVKWSKGGGERGDNDAVVK